MKEETRKYYWDNGQLSEEISIRNGEWHGLSKWWYSNGQLHIETPYKNNLQCGAMIIFEYKKNGKRKVQTRNDR